MTNADYRKAKRNICTIAAAMAILLLLFVCLLIKKDNPELSLDTLTRRLSQPQEVFVKLDNTTYTLPGGEGLALLFGEAEKAKGVSGEGSWITLHFGELYEFYIYENGIVEGFDGYAPRRTKSSAYYSANSNLHSALRQDILSHGTVCSKNIGIFK